MTREDAERKIRSVFTNYFQFAGDREADEVIEALRQEPCEDMSYELWKESYEVLKERMDRLTLCGDAISRKALLDDLYGRDYTKFTHRDFVALVQYQDTVQPKQKTGHWIFDEILDKHYYCSECKSMGVDYWDYCPNCGAKMIEPQERSKE